MHAPFVFYFLQIHYSEKYKQSFSLLNLTYTFNFRKKAIEEQNRNKKEKAQSHVFIKKNGEKYLLEHLVRKVFPDSDMAFRSFITVFLFFFLFFNF